MYKHLNTLKIVYLILPNVIHTEQVALGRSYSYLLLLIILYYKSYIYYIQLFVIIVISYFEKGVACVILK